MPASRRRPPRRIKDANVRYHDVAAAEYDSKWGIDFGPIGQGAGARQGRRRRSAAGRHAPSGRARDRLRHRLLLAQPAAARPDRAAGRDRHLARDARRRCAATAERLGLEVRDGGDRRRARCRSRTESFDLVFGHAVLHHLPDLDAAPRRSSTACCGPAARSRSAASPRATATCSPRCPKRGGAAGRTALAAAARAPPRGRGGTRPSAATATSSSPRSTSTPSRPGRSPRCSRAPASTTSRIRGEELLANAYGWTVRTLEGTAEPEEVPDALARVRLPQLPGPAAASTRRCSSRGCRRRSSTTSC